MQFVVIAILIDDAYNMYFQNSFDSNQGCIIYQLNIGWSILTWPSGVGASVNKVAFTDT